MADVKMKHPDARRQVTVREDQVRQYETQGWQRVESAAKKAPAKKATAKKAAPAAPAADNA